MKILKVVVLAGVMAGSALSYAQEGEAKAPSVKKESSVAVDEVGASMTPAEKHQQRLENERMRDGGQMTPKMKAAQNSAKFPTEHHKNAYHSLSDKNKKAYDALEDHEQDKVAETYRNGGNHQRTLTNILKSDQKDHNKMMKNKDMDEKDMHLYQHDKGMSDSPATRAMKKQSQQKKKKDDIFS